MIPYNCYCRGCSEISILQFLNMLKKTAEFVRAYGKGIELTKNGCQMVKGRLGGWGRGQRFCHKMMRLNPIHVGIVFVCTTPGQKGCKKKCSVELHWLLTVLKSILPWYWWVTVLYTRSLLEGGQGPSSKDFPDQQRHSPPALYKAVVHFYKRKLQRGFNFTQLICFQRNGWKG